MTTQVAAGLGWPGRAPAPDSLAPERPPAGLGWPDPRGVVTPPEWADVLVPSRATRPQDPAASHEAERVSAKVVGVADAVQHATGAVSVVGAENDLSVVAPATTGPDASPVEVSRETELQTPHANPRDTAPHDGGSVSRETVAADEATPLADTVSEPHDTPIAQAAATAVRVLGGRYGSPMPRPAATRVMTVANQKGGVGKTTSTVNLAAALALHGAEVLVVDLDPQGNASTALGVDHHSDVPSVYDVLIEGRPVDEVVTEVEGLKGLSCVPATIDLAGAEIELVSVVARESRLKKALDAYATYRAEHGQARLDYVLVDCPPSLGLLTVNALVAAEEVLIPIQCEYYALEGLGQLIRNVDLVKAHLNPRLHVSTILLTMYDARTRLAAQVADEVRAHFTDTVLRTTIPRSVRISEAPSYGQTVLTYDPASTGALSYLEAAREMAVRGAGPDAKETTS